MARIALACAALLALSGCVGFQVNFVQTSEEAKDYCKRIMLEQNERRDVPVWEPSHE